MTPVPVETNLPHQTWIDKISAIERTADAAWHIGGEDHMRLTLEDVANRLSDLLATARPAAEVASVVDLVARSGCSAGTDEGCTNRLAHAPALPSGQL